MSFVLIEHDLDIALRVVERVTVMHNGRVLKARHAERDRERRRRCRRSTWEASTDGLGSRFRQAARAAQRLRRARGPGGSARARSERPGRLLRPRPCAAGSELRHRTRHHRHRRPQRHGQDDAVQCHHGPRARHRQREAARRGDPRPRAQRDHAARHRLRAAGPARVAVAERRGDAASRRAPQARGGAGLRDVPAPGRAQGPRRGAALGRRAADARHRPRAAARAAPAGDGRAHRGPRAVDRRAGGSGAAPARRRRRDSRCC